MDLNSQKEQFSIAYVQATAAVGKLKILRHNIDDESIDLTLRRTSKRSPSIDLQLKCTSEPIPPPGTDIAFRLSVKNYNDLAREAFSPKLLVVMFVPEESHNWLIPDPAKENVMLRYGAWYLDLKGMPERMNQTSITVSIPRTNIFRHEVLNNELDKLENEFIPS